RITVEIGSQADPGFLAHLTRTYRPDIIVDDGSHQADHMALTFERMFPALAPGGLYVIEDVYLHHGEFAERFNAGGQIAATERFAGLAGLVAAEHLEPDRDLTTRYFFESIQSIEFVPGAIIVRKTKQEDDAAALRHLWTLAERVDRAPTWHAMAG